VFCSEAGHIGGGGENSLKEHYSYDYGFVVIRGFHECICSSKIRFVVVVFNHALKFQQWRQSDDEIRR
jgi:hypothetical protein